MIFTYRQPTTIIHGRGSIDQLAGELAKAGVHSVIIVTDQGLSQAGIAGKVASKLMEAEIKVVIFDLVEHNAPLAIVEEGAAVAREAGVEGVVALGGGSSLASGKAVASMATNPGNYRDYVKVSRLPVEPLPVFAVPTTAGSGSEVSPSCPVTDAATSKKFAIRTNQLYPRIAILDPDLLASLPPMAAVYAGIDALTHAMESFISKLATPITEALALRAIADLTRYLPRACYTSDMEAKEKCLIASTMANMSCGNARLGLVHHLAGRINGIFPTLQYGYTIGVLLPRVMAFNMPVNVEKFAQMAAAMGQQANNPLKQAELVITAVKRLQQDLLFPAGFQATEIPAEALPRLARLAMGLAEDAPEGEVARARLTNTPNIRSASYHEILALYQQCFIY